MSEWITDRLPTSSESDEHGCVWFTGSTGSVYRRHHTNFDLGEPWMAIPKGKPPEPYVPPEPKRREYTMDGIPRHLHSVDVCSGEPNAVLCEPSYGKQGGIQLREVLPGDPDPETVATIAKEMAAYGSGAEWVHSSSVANWAKMLKGGQ